MLAVGFGDSPSRDWTLLCQKGPPLVIAWPRFEIDGKLTSGRVGAIKRVSSGRVFGEVIETVYDVPLTDYADVTLRLVTRIAPDSPVLRLRYELHSTGNHKLTKSAGFDAIEYLNLAIGPADVLSEIRFSDFQETPHSYLPTQVDVRSELLGGSSVMGPILLVDGNATGPLLIAYEHGSQFGDAFLRFDFDGSTLTLAAAKANYLRDQPLDAAHHFESPWLHVFVGASASDYRQFFLKYQSGNFESRKPYLYYNTWNYQERLQGWHGKKYLEEMHSDRMLREIDVAAKMGIETFVIDTGWFSRTGDWRVNETRFPENMRAVREKLQAHHMKLGLWFDNAAAVSSAMLAAHRDCVQRVGTADPKPAPVWETEDSLRLCPVSRWWMAFADELIRVHHELGVSYFKLDAIQQMNVWSNPQGYCCDDPAHEHGDASHTPAERAERFAYLLPLYLAKIVERVRASVPDAILDFDMTEAGRCFGLAYLSASKFFLVNNGPYYHNYNLPQPKDRNSNIFFYPGPARNRIVRTTTAFDQWVPLTLMLAHYLPDEPGHFQMDSIASTILGHNGFWGDLCALSDAGASRIGQWMSLYKQVREQITAADPIVTGSVGSSREVHEKIHNGKGAVCLFGSATGRFEYVTRHPVSATYVASEGAQVDILHTGRAKISVSFSTTDTAAVVLFGAAR
jgi:alpha-galactosidase